MTTDRELGPFLVTDYQVQDDGSIVATYDIPEDLYRRVFPSGPGEFSVGIDPSPSLSPSFRREMQSMITHAFDVHPVLIGLGNLPGWPPRSTRAIARMHRAYRRKQRGWKR